LIEVAKDICPRKIGPSSLIRGKELRINMPNYSKDIEAEVVFILPEHGGRKNPIVSGLRPIFFYDGMAWDGVMHFDTEEQIPKGIPVTMYFAFTRPEYHFGKIFMGKEFQLLDGPQIIAKGRVLRLIDLEKSANNVNLNRHKLGG
jgi:translation elongation factor EF-Tu-like GTPase